MNEPMNFAEFMECRRRFTELAEELGLSKRSLLAFYGAERERLLREYAEEQSKLNGESEDDTRD